jgi:hypothetical protein
LSAAESPPPELSIAQTLRTDRPLSGRQWRILVQQVLVVTAVACFLASLPLPAIAPDMGAWPHGEPYPGWLCALVAAQLYPLNGMILLSPLWTWYLRGRRRPLVQLIVAGLLSIPIVLAGVGAFRERQYRDDRLYVGYYLWVASYLLVMLAAWIPVWLRRSGGAGFTTTATPGRR